jgi:lysylphosphatidylglycerol synthetase-like protein (DUF2156 family)
VPLAGLCLRVGMEATTVREGYELWRPNREKAQSKTTKAIVAFVLLVSAGLIAVIVIGGWARMQSSMIAIMSLVWALLYVVFAILIARWNRGLLPVAASLAVIMTIFAAVAAPGWFARSKDGLDSPILPEDLIGLLVIILIPVQILLIVVSLIAFGQEWHVEEERPIGGRPLAGEDDDPDGYDEGESNRAPSPSPA